MDRAQQGTQGTQGAANAPIPSNVDLNFLCAQLHAAQAFGTWDMVQTLQGKVDAVRAQVEEAERQRVAAAEWEFMHR